LFGNPQKLTYFDEKTPFLVEWVKFGAFSEQVYPNPYNAGISFTRFYERSYAMLKRPILCSLLAALAISVTGSAALATQYARTVKPSYVLEPTDIINVEAIHIAPKAPYQLRTFDVIMVDVIGAPEEAPISGFFALEPGGRVQLGSGYGSVQIGGLSADEAEAAITKHLEGTEGNALRLIAPTVSVRLQRMGDLQQIAGNYTIGPDGFITLGIYGRVYVSGLTIDECREAIEFHLGKSLEHPQVAVDVFSYNSKAYYVIVSSALGDQIVKFPYTGNDMVLDALAHIGSLPPQSSRQMWIERPVSNSDEPVRLPVDLTIKTNYQLLPGDRIVVQMSDPVMAPAGNRVVIQERRFRPFGGVLIRSFGGRR